MSDIHPPELAATQPKAGGAVGRFVRIELPGKQRTLTLAEVEVFSDGRNVALTPLEFRLLRYLMHNSGRVVAPAELFDHIYASEQNAGSNALEVLVNRTRKKLGNAVIGTRRGYGYILDA